MNKEGQISELRGTAVANCGEIVEYGESVMKVSDLDNADYLKSVDDFFSSLISSGIEKESYKTGNHEIDTVTGKMWQTLSDAASLMLRKLAYSAPIIIRFHNDADGCGGACALHIAMNDFCSKLKAKGNVVWLMHRKIAYSRSDAQGDILISNNYSSLEKPLLVIIDFGTTTDSNPGIRELWDRFDVIWLDHHPVQEGFDAVKIKHYINPWNFGGDSNYTAGLLTSIFCKTFSAANTNEFAQASLIGDYSDFANSESSDLSTLLDFITSDLVSVFGNSKMNATPQEIISIIDNKERMREVLNYARVRMDEAMDNGRRSLKRHSSGGIELYVLNFENIRSEDSKYPLPGRFASKLLGEISESGRKNAVLFVHAGPYISVRISKSVGKRIDLLKIIDEIKMEFGKSIDAGGGHAFAAGIKVIDESEKKEIIKAIMKRMKNE